jgi:hypothetical protein
LKIILKNDDGMTLAAGMVVFRSALIYDNINQNLHTGKDDEKSESNTGCH